MKFQAGSLKKYEQRLMRVDRSKFEERMSNKDKNVASRAVSWITGQKI